LTYWLAVLLVPSDSTSLGDQVPGDALHIGDIPEDCQITVAHWREHHGDKDENTEAWPYEDGDHRALIYARCYMAFQP
jgi:hypothetical protein